MDRKDRNLSTSYFGSLRMGSPGYALNIFSLNIKISIPLFHSLFILGDPILNFPTIGENLPKSPLSGIFRFAALIQRSA